MTHQFNTKIAEKYGIEEAILIEHLYFWIHKNECEKEMFKDGRTWCYSSAKAFNKYIAYMNPQKIRRILLKLETIGFIKIGNYNKSGLNQTLWYSFTDKAIEELIDNKYDFSKIKNGDFKNEKCEDINKEDKEKNNINKNIDIEKKSANEEENRFIVWMQKEYPHVCKMKKPLTLDEYNKLRDLGYSPDQITSKLDVLENRDDYIRRYRSPYLCVRNWLKSDFTKVKR